MAFSSLITCVVRDPGPVTLGADSPNEEEVGITQALMSTEEDYSAPGKWCRKCWVRSVTDFILPVSYGLQGPKYERTHHCATCGRCVLKMGEQSCKWMYLVCLIEHRSSLFVDCI